MIYECSSSTNSLFFLKKEEKGEGVGNTIELIFFYLQVHFQRQLLGDGARTKQVLDADVAMGLLSFWLLL
jgi:hypothetical protein